MKKTFKRTAKLQYERWIDSVKNEVRKYLKRERKKKLPEGTDYWDFECQYGSEQETAKAIHVAELIKYIDQAAAQNRESFYLQILAKPRIRSKQGTAPQKDSAN
ncbi:DUF6172 family protein [Pelagicoccus albus]|uniref:Uncharacterized protein n=1 Tax=Pelagicoccus albus TaxID=415222 RepID=A0A7X1E6I5_9BACT|nr:DUF6172 family protein [Pelagicoccus albus]MBC2604730.1 hypothetical protein [Pelagicoccus albus]